ncbi:MAG: RHS repeat-associated core domain-containing protein [Bacteroidales bacterium]
MLTNTKILSKHTSNCCYFTTYFDSFSSFVFNGKEKDYESGFHYYGARYYASELSTWLSTDPMSDKYPSLTPYNYCANNPVKLIDPNGEEVILPPPISPAIRFYNLARQVSKTINKITHTTKLHNTKEALYHYFRGNGKPMEIADNIVHSLLKTEKFKEKHNKIVSGQTFSAIGEFYIDMTNVEYAYFIGRTQVHYSVENLDKNNYRVNYDLFVKDGFWDVDVLDEKVMWKLIKDSRFKPDGPGPNLERLGGVPYEFKEKRISIDFKLTDTPSYEKTTDK